MLMPRDTPLFTLFSLPRRFDAAIAALCRAISHFDANISDTDIFAATR